MVGIRKGEGLTVGIWFDENLVRVVGDKTKMFLWSDAWIEGDFV